MAELPIPEGELGDWRVEKVSFTEERAAFFNTQVESIYHVEPMTYTLLSNSEGCIMTDLPLEIEDQRLFSEAAEGKVLIGGLGLGITPNIVAEKLTVTSVLVVEVSPDVVSLVSPYLHAKVQVVQGDVFTFDPVAGGFSE